MLPWAVAPAKHEEFLTAPIFSNKTQTSLPLTVKRIARRSRRELTVAPQNSNPSDTTDATLLHHIRGTCTNYSEQAILAEAFGPLGVQNRALISLPVTYLLAEYKITQTPILVDRTNQYIPQLSIFAASGLFDFIVHDKPINVSYNFDLRV